MVRKLKLTKKEDNKQQTIWETNAYYRKRYLKGANIYSFKFLPIARVVIILNEYIQCEILGWIRIPLNLMNRTIQMNNDFTSDNNTHFESGYVIPK